MLNYKNPQTIFLCGARDFHAMDWYKSAKKKIKEPKPIILTDLIAAEGFKKLISPDDIVHKLIILDSLLLKSQSRLGNMWRNLLKVLVFPLQVIILKRFNLRYKDTIYYAHSMYYLWLAWAAGVRFVGTPQGSDILIKPKKSSVYKILSIFSMRAALFITVDSNKMADGVEELIAHRPMVIQNGIDIGAIKKIYTEKPRELIVSFRGITPLYRVDELVEARNISNLNKDKSITFIYPFHEKKYLSKIAFNKKDKKTGRLLRDEMYQIFFSTLLAISIPVSDSSPRSVYEAIFCGAIIAITWQSYFDDLPECMKSRIIVVNLSDSKWLDNAIDSAKKMIDKPFTPSDEAWERFDQEICFTKVHEKTLQFI